MPRGESVSVLVSGPSDAVRMKLPANRYLNASGDAYLVMQPDCILYTYKGPSALSKTNWTLNQPTGPSTNWNCYLDMQADGNFVVYTWNGSENNPDATKPLWAADTASNGYVSSGHRFVVLGRDGNLSMYGPDFSKLSLKKELAPIVAGTAFGGSNATDNVLTPNLAYPFPPEAAWKPNLSLDGFPYLPAEYFLNQGSRLQSADGKLHLVLGPDCSLRFQEIWPENNTVKQVIWEPTPGVSNVSESCQLVLQPDGRLQIKNNGSSGTVYWSSAPAGDFSVNWVLKLISERGGYLVVSDILDSNTQLWSSVAAAASVRWWWIVVGVVSGVLAVTVAGLAFWYFCARESKLHRTHEGLNLTF